MSLRATWRVNYKDNDSAQNLIASKRINLDEKLAKIEGVHFFFSSITGTRTKVLTSRKKRTGWKQANKDPVQTRKMIQ